MIMSLCAAAFTLLLVVPLAQVAAQSRDLRIGVDRRVELIAIIFKLGGSEEFSPTHLPQYSADPVSPRMSTVESVGATLATCASTRRRAVDDPTISSNIDERSMSSRSARVLVVDPLFGLFPVMDIRTGDIPSNHVPLFIPE